MGTNSLHKPNPGGILLLACGALAKETIKVIEHNRLTDIYVQCLPARLHHRPALIPQALDQAITKYKPSYQTIYVVYGDCGTAGGIDEVLKRHQVERIGGPHCFSFYEGNDRFSASEDDVTSFFLTDFFCRHFEKFMWKEYGLDRDKSMVPFLFGNYKKLVYIAQTQDSSLKSKALEIAQRLELDFEYRYRGYSDLGLFIKNLAL